MLRDTEWDGTHLDHFMQMLCRLNARHHGFGAADILSIEAAWDEPDSVAWSGGLIARLNGGRRAYVEGAAGLDQWGDDSRMDAHLTSNDADGSHAWNDHLGRCLNQFFSTMATR